MKPGVPPTPTLAQLEAWEVAADRLAEAARREMGILRNEYGIRIHALADALSAYDAARRATR